MKKLFVLFAAMAVTFLMSADLHSSNEGAGNDRSGIMYCVFDKWAGYCFKHIDGIGCYLVDSNCNWIDDQTPPED
jgi:hypothetical protein